MADTNAQAAPAKSKGKGKKLVIVMVAVVLLLVAVGAAALVLLSQRGGGDEEEGDGDQPRASAKAPKPKGPPTFLPMDNLVVNLADPGGDRFAQIGITLELLDGKTAEEVKTYMPAIRSEVLKQVSRRGADELLTPEGKDKLAQDIRREAARPLGYALPKPRKPRPKAQEEDEDDAPPPPPPSRTDDNPVRAVHFSSFIIQ